MFPFHFTERIFFYGFCTMSKNMYILSDSRKIIWICHVLKLWTTDWSLIHIDIDNWYWNMLKTYNVYAIWIIALFTSYYMISSDLMYVHVYDTPWSYVHVHDKLWSDVHEKHLAAVHILDNSLATVHVEVKFRSINLLNMLW